MYIIYFNTNKLVLISSEENRLYKSAKNAEIIYENELSKGQVLKISSQLTSGNRDKILVSDNPEKSFSQLSDSFNVIRAGGGFVYTPEKQVLLIFRRGKWDLPKGKLDEGESLEECAVREVEEETGVTNIILEKSLMVTYHTYLENGKSILKASYWYLMKTNFQTLQPQTEEDITECKWVNFGDLNTYMRNTHASIKDVIAVAQTKFE